MPKDDGWRYNRDQHQPKQTPLPPLSDEIMMIVVWSVGLLMVGLAGAVVLCLFLDP
jgi:hypothetical protein